MNQSADLDSVKGGTAPLNIGLKNIYFNRDIYVIDKSQNEE